MPNVSLPQPVATESRISFGINWYSTVEQADFVGGFIKEYYAHITHKPLGRAPEFDKDVEAGLFSGPAYAVKVP